MRFYQYLLEDHTITSILREIEKFENPVSRTGRNVRAYDHRRVKSIHPIGWAGTKTLMFKGLTEASDGEHEPIIMFYGLEVSPTQTPQTPVEVDIDGTSYWFEKPTASDTKCRIRCTCKDHRFRWQWWLARDAALIGKPKPYKRKTTYWPPVNPKKVVGICKHQYALLRKLQILNLMGE